QPLPYLNGTSTIGKNSLNTACPRVLRGCSPGTAGTIDGEIMYIADCSLPRWSRISATASPWVNASGGPLSGSGLFFCTAGPQASICGTNSFDDFHGIGSPDTARNTDHVVI